MLKYIQIGEFSVPSYSMMILVGVIVCNLIAQKSYEKSRQRYIGFLYIELISGIGAIIGAKAMSLLKISVREHSFPLSWNDFLKAGYSYYGGLVGFFVVAYLICRIKKIDSEEYACEYLYLIPLLHAFWKIGCLMGGCCYGIEYNGAIAIIYPLGINKLSGSKVFPSPLIEALVSLAIVCVLLLARKSTKKIEVVSLFLFLYSSTRFILEFFRYHETSSILSDGQICSLICGSIGLYLYIRNMRGRERKRDE